MTRDQLAAMIDHTLLKPTATTRDIRQLCVEAMNEGFAAVCVNPVHVECAAKMLAGSGVAVCTVIGFPLGATTPSVKRKEAGEAIKNGALEVDMVINIGALKEGNLDLVLNDIREVVEAVTTLRPDGLVKVIIETGYLNREEKITACRLAWRAGAHFVKTSTGFGPAGATVDDVELLRKNLPPEMGVKASGGIRTTGQALALIAAGATRLGTSAGPALLTGLQND
ncbi:deoxyribose-phosphate aldolase [Desulfofundulus thermocisternus]|uniref:deoxyribose-phosphate aldolase n=1 Tax=Desulfofundulus thermocisternus TaxID=42471 RepID=UPI001A04CFAD|nr:deoxyribose-phosphate aldolase [Desulfofundulus thermocisternus]MBE3586143.1 deoxyribose-phosphate aldolase [Thermoanaerobacter sp.]MCS5694915.1 deoxyribose-phosphate aldolase [Desulfofundulus thermocisternus]